MNNKPEKTKIVAPARIGNDGESVRCGARFTIDANGATRHQCDKKLGERWFVEDTSDDDPRYHYFAVGFHLPREFGLDRNGDFYRHTERPDHRTEGKRYVISLSPNRTGGKISAAKGKAEKRVDRESTEWGSAGDFALPVRVLCPECKRLNLITESLIESETKKMAA